MTSPGDDEASARSGDPAQDADNVGRDHAVEAVVGRVARCVRKFWFSVIFTCLIFDYQVLGPAFVNDLHRWTSLIQYLERSWWNFGCIHHCSMKFIIALWSLSGQAVNIKVAERMKFAKK